MIPNAASMPELPGMWYDSTTNRYYRETQDNPRPRATPPPPPPTSRRPRADAPRLTRQRETSTLSASALSAVLVSSARRRIIRGGNADVETQSVTEHAGCLPLATANCEVELLHYPTGAVLESLALSHPALAISWRPKAALLAVAVRAATAFDHVLVVHFPQRRAPLTLLVPHIVRGEVHAIALSDTGCVLTAASPHSFVFPAPGGRGGGAVTLNHPDKSDGVAAELLGERDALVGTRAGSIYRWDLRAPAGAPCAALRTREAGAAVACMRASRDPTRIFVSSMRNGAANLCAWDWRMPRDGPLLCFAGHVNECKPLS
eukprot:IDg12666t1